MNFAVRRPIIQLAAMPPKPKKVSLPPTYTIYVHAVAGHNIPAVEGRQTTNPYLVVRLVGGDQKVISRVIENSPTPFWDEYLQPLDGFGLGNDLLRLQILDKDTVQGSRNDDIIGQYELPLRDLPLGLVIEGDVPLIRTNSKGKPEMGAGPGTGGIVKLRFNIAWPGQEPWTHAPWAWPFYTAVVEFTSAANLPATDPNLKAEPYLVAILDPSLNPQRAKTKTATDSANPIWNDQKPFLLAAAPRIR
jgi:hypothetical protein